MINELNFIKDQLLLKFFKVQIKETPKKNYNHYHILFTFDYVTHRYTNIPYKLHKILKAGYIVYPNEFTLNYWTTSIKIIEELMNYCVKNDPTNTLALEYQSLLKAWCKFKNLDDVERLKLFIAVDTFNYRRHGLKVLPSRKWITAIKVCKHWLEKKPIKPRIFYRINFYLNVLKFDPMYSKHLKD